MSTHWDPYCVTCGNGPRHMLWYNGNPAVVRSLLDALPQLIALHDARTAFQIAMGERDSYFNVTLETSCMEGHPTLDEIAEWARAHAGHELAVMNEYGQLDTQCHARWLCNGGHHHDCELDDKHEGPHGPKAAA